MNPHESFGPVQNSIPGVTDLLSHANAGVDQLLYYNNVAITALTVCLLFALLGNLMQFYFNRIDKNRSEKEWLDRFLGMNDTMAKVNLAFNVLLERLNHHD